MKTLGQLFMFGVEGTKITRPLASFLKETGCGGVILFKRNIVNLTQLASFIRDIKDAAEGQLIIGVDHEGGRVFRLPEPFTAIPPMAALAANAAFDPGIIRRTAQAMGRELKGAGFDIDFAPVVDVATNAFNPVIGDRAFSRDADEVARMGAEFIEAMQGIGVAACAKHFPGHGDTDADSHFGLPVLNHTRRRFDLCELVPFRAAVRAKVASMMTAHIMAPNLDPHSPASISRPITTGILRDELGFDGVVFTDDLTMKGIAQMHSPAESAWRAIAAGADIAMVCHDDASKIAALEGLKRALDEGKIDHAQLAKSLDRIALFRAKYLK